MAPEGSLTGGDESGIRHTFSVRRVAPVPSPGGAPVAELARWCGIFDAEGLAPVVGGASAGNLSVRSPDGFVITPTRSRLKSGLDGQEFVEVVGEDLERWELTVRGKNVPSSDAFLHGRIYAARPGVGAVFHGHDPLVLAQAEAIRDAFGVTCSEAALRFGTRRDAEETARALGSGSYVIRPGHGFVATGATPDLAGELALRIHRFAAEESRRR